MKYGVFLIKRHSFADTKHMTEMVFIGFEQIVSMNDVTGSNMEYSLRVEIDGLKSVTSAGVSREIASRFVKGCNETPKMKTSPAERRNIARSTEFEADLSLYFCIIV